MKWLISFIVAASLIALISTIGVGFYLSPQDKLAKADAIVAISGGETVERTNEAVRLYQDGWATKIVFSGAARDQGTSNAESMKQLAIKQGIAPENILIEEKAQDTFDNAKYVGELLADNNIHSIILVTSPYHQRRASSTFRHSLGKEFVIINHSAADSAWRKNGWWKNDWARALTWSELQKILLLPFVLPVVTK